MLENVAVSPPARVDFREERHNRLLKEPLVLTGYLEYLEMGRLRKVVETPFSESYLVDGDRIEVSRNGKVRSIPLDGSGMLRTVLSGIDAILAGQTDRLRKEFDCTLRGTANDWAMELTPRSEEVSRHLERLLVTGNASSVTSMRFELGDSEWHLLEILPDESEP